jgi:microcystin-dependent protein
MIPVVLPKVDGVSTQPAAEMNSLFYEIENLITSTDATLSGASAVQLQQAVAVYSSGADFYVDTGAANSYVLEAIGSKESPTAYFDGMRIRFIPDNSNSAAATVNVAGIGPIAMASDTSATALIAGAVVAGTEIELYYHAFNTTFVISNISPVQIQNGSFNYAVDSGAANAIVANFSPAITAPVPGTTITVKIAAANTGATTINVNGGGAIAVVKFMNNGSNALSPYDIQTNYLAQFQYNGTNWVLTNPLSTELPGKVIADASGVAQNGFLLCDGTSYATSAQPALFARVGYTWGGSGANFNVPDLRGRGIIGAGAGAGLTVRTTGQTLGAETSSAILAHTHTITDPGHHHTYNDYTLQNAGTGTGGSAQDQIPGTSTSTSSTGITATNSTGSGSSFSLMNPEGVCLWQIKA